NEVAAGRYWAQFSENVTAMAHPSFTSGFGAYMNPAQTPAGNAAIAGSEVRFPDYKSPSHADTVFNGNWRWNVEPTAPVVA
ncbi:hypothetical protein L6232_26410, partial [Shewanella sp. C31]|nr:hypothetical protein [Shewanella electrica]